MKKFVKKVSKKAGLAPGTLVHVGEQKIERARMRIIDYDESRIEEKDLERIEEAFDYKDQNTVTWINIDGLHELDIIEKIGRAFDLHPLVLEDIVHTDQRPKAEDYEENLFIITKMLSYEDTTQRVNTEQFSIVLGKSFLLTFQERPGDVFEPVRERLRKGKGRVRTMGPDYLAYALMDALVDNYFIVLERLTTQVEDLEDLILTSPSPAVAHYIHHLKRELIFLRKAVWPLREVINNLQRGESELITEKTSLFVRDVYDHTIQVIDTIETLRDVVSGLLDIYLSSVSNRMNEIMKVLTVIATLFIPLTFIAGIYGMNFKFMPELAWKWSYPLLLLLMVILAAGMFIWFRRKRFL